MLLKSTQKICADLLFPKKYGNKLSAKKSAICNHFYPQHFFLTVLLLFSINSYAQFDPRVDCTNGCTSNDIQIKTAYLVEPNSPYNPLTSSFQCQGAANVKLALELTTKTPRVGVFIYARVVNKLDPTIIYATVSECFSTALASVGTTKVVFSQNIGWPCGTEILLTDVFIGWGTGNTDFCQGASTPRCPGTPSKCYSLPPGQYITVIIPTAGSTIAEKCSDAPGGTTATFNLTSLNSTIIGSQQNVSVTWYSNVALTNLINNPGAYVSGTTQVFAKVTNNSDPSAFTYGTVTLNVFVTPVANSASATLCSSDAGGTTASFNLTGLGSTILNGQTGVTLSWYSDAAFQNSISSPYVTGSTIVYAKLSNNNAASCSSSVAVPLTVNRIPTVSTASSTLCSTSPGGTTASFDLSSLEATIINGQQNVGVTWYSNIELTTGISSPHVTGTTTVYAKVTNSNAASCYNSIAVPLTVNRTPTVSAASSTLCSSDPGGTTASFNLTGLEATIINGQQNVGITWYSNIELSASISSPHVTGSTTVYAKVSNSSASNCYSSVAVPLTVNRTPTVTAASSTLCSTSPGGTTASFNLTALEATIINGQQNVGVTWYGNIGLTTAISSPHVTGTTTVYAKVTNSNATSCYNSIAVSLTVNRTPTVSAAISTLCSTDPGGTTASFDLSSLEATIINGQQNVGITWYSNIELSASISSPHVAATTTVYAKVSNSNAANCYSSIAVPLTVNRTPTVTSTSAILCSTDGGGTTASFDLSGLATTILNGQSNVSLNWYSDAAFQNSISSPYVTGTTTVYAKVTNTNAASCTNSIAISLTVNSRPGTITADVTQPTCAVSTGTITVTSSKAGLTFSLNSINPADFTNATGIFASLAPGNYVIRSKSSAGCISDGVTKEVLAAAGATPAADVLIVTHPSCTSSTGTLKVVKAGSLEEYDNSIFEFSNGGDFTDNPVFSFKAGEGYSITVRRKLDHTCFAITSCEGEAPITENPAAINNTQQPEQVMITAPLSVAIKAIPNPFADRVRFSVTTERAGNGSIEVFNMQGQKVKTVYSGFVPAGISYYDLEVTGQSSGQLIYVLRIGSEKISGRLVRVNR
ncbi:beta strand repeat-containing protein [Lacibacter sediminis]|uniref:Ig-like domain-containing protein n=1 Tax=Lacibacter sediminis TaxID=2760713 RepID=A0A7G5XBL6_9BACT|nr:hypothetical protein [Lacibacter sediminis]QNA42869.1 hypothetical protein H4075_12270 [Lacibacter sediminis]